MCERTLGLDERVYPQVVGYEKPGRGVGGRSGSSLVLRERTGRVACVACVTALLYGVTSAQMTFDEAEATL